MQAGNTWWYYFGFINGGKNSLRSQAQLIGHESMGEGWQEACLQAGVANVLCGANQSAVRPLLTSSATPVGTALGDGRVLVGDGE